MLFQFAGLNAQIDRDATDRCNLIRPANVDHQDLLRLTEQRIEFRSCEHFGLSRRGLLGERRGRGEKSK